MRRSSSWRASTAADSSALGGCRVLRARCRSRSIRAEKRARLTCSRGLAARHTSITCRMMSQHVIVSIIRKQSHLVGDVFPLSVAIEPQDKPVGLAGELLQVVLYVAFALGGVG